MRIHLLLVTLVPGLAFSTDDSEPQTKTLQVSPFFATDSWLKSNLLQASPFSATDFGLKSNTLPVSSFLATDYGSKTNTPSTPTDSKLKTSTPPVFTSLGMVHETIVVVPDNQDLSPPEKNRWVKFEEALGPGLSASRRHRTFGWRNNDGTRVECYEPCVINCCVGSGGFSLTGDGGL